MIADETCYEALRARETWFDGLVFVAVKSTGIYCRSVRTARTPKPASGRFFETAAGAEKAGFRACLLCRPELAPAHYAPERSLVHAIGARLRLAYRRPLSWEQMLRYRAVRAIPGVESVVGSHYLRTIAGGPSPRSARASRAVFGAPGGDAAMADHAEVPARARGPTRGARALPGQTVAARAWLRVGHEPERRSTVLEFPPEAASNLHPALLARAEAWRPWRAYAAVSLWHLLSLL